jgi:prophage regulatory protein
MSKTSARRPAPPSAAPPEARACWPRDQETVRQTNNLSLISMAETARRVMFSRVHVYRLIAAGKFPRPVKLGEARVAFVEAEVDDFIRARIAERDCAEVGAA